MLNSLSYANPDNNFSKTALKYSPLGIMIRVIQQSFNTSDLGNLLSHWISNYREKTHLVACEHLDKKWGYVVLFELHFIFTFYYEFYNIQADLTKINEVVAKPSDLHYSS